MLTQDMEDIQDTQTDTQMHTHTMGTLETWDIPKIKQ